MMNNAKKLWCRNLYSRRHRHDELNKTGMTAARDKVHTSRYIDPLAPCYTRIYRIDTFTCSQMHLDLIMMISISK